MAQIHTRMIGEFRVIGVAVGEKGEMHMMEIWDTINMFVISTNTMRMQLTIEIRVRNK